MDEIDPKQLGKVLAQFQRTLDRMSNELVATRLLLQTFVALNIANSENPRANFERIRDDARSSVERISLSDDDPASRESRDRIAEAMEMYLSEVEQVDTLPC